MSADRELLELAAKAAGIWVGEEEFADPIDRKYTDNLGLWVHVGRMEDQGHWWNPLNNDGDALRLAVKLTLHIDITPWATDCGRWDNYSSSGATTDAYQSAGDDHAAATRRAIVRAAAEIGKARHG